MDKLGASISSNICNPQMFARMNKILGIRHGIKARDGRNIGRGSNGERERKKSESDAENTGRKVKRNNESGG